MDLTDADLHRIELDLDSLRKPTIAELRAMLSEIRASRTEIRTMHEFLTEAIAAHRSLGDAIQKTGEIR